jgi:AcrR family transcriptional regulator
VDARRRQLLDATGRLVATGGPGAVSMVAVAREAGVSRRLVYDHFPDLASLYEAFFDDTVARSLGAIDTAAHGSEPDRGFARAFAALLAIPVEDQRAIRLLLTGSALPDLAPLHRRFRAHVEARWLPGLRAAGVDARIAPALLWTLTIGLLGLVELVERGEVDAASATTLADDLVTAAIASAAAPTVADPIPGGA